VCQTYVEEIPLEERWLASLYLLLALVGAGAACSVPPTDRPEPTTAPPTRGPTTTGEPAGPIEAASPVPSSPTPSPADPTPPLTPVAEPARTAFYAAGSEGIYPVFAVREDGKARRLDLGSYPGARVSLDGRWIATADQELPAGGITLFDLRSDARYTVQVRTHFDPYGMAFDKDGTRLAFLELGSPGAMDTPWAMVIVDLADRSTTRFEATYGDEEGMMPANPMGWVGDELLVNSFVPFTEVGSAGVWALRLPVGTESTPVETLERRQMLPRDGYLFAPRLSPRGGELVYLNRDYDYTPDNYGPVGYDLAVNQLGLLDVEDPSPSVLIEETDGGALGGAAAWSPDGSRILFAEGRYGNGVFASLTLKTAERAGTIAEIGAAPLPPEGFLVSLDWCVPEWALVNVATKGGAHELHTVDMETGTSSMIASDERIAVLGCVRQPDDGGQGNADVVRVRAVQTGGPAPGEGETTWTFHVTVEHPDTGWEDYADGWDVVAPEGQVLKPDPEDAFTRVLLHPHVEEQPFTRSQSGVVVREDVTQVRVRAHDIVDGFGGKEVVVDLTEESGPDFEVEWE